MATSTFEEQQVDAAAGDRSGEIDLAGEIWRVRLLDIVMIGAAVALAQVVRFGNQDWHDSTLVYTSVSVALALLWWLFLGMERAYDPRVLGRGIEEYRRVAIATIKLFGGIAVLSTIFGVVLARGYLLIALPVGLVALLAARWLCRRTLARSRRSGVIATRVLLVGAATAVSAAAESIGRAPELGYRVVGACVTGDGGGGAAITVGGKDIPVLGGARDVLDAIDRSGADTVAVTDTDQLGHAEMRNLGWTLHERGLDLIVAPVVTDFAGPRLRPQATTGLTLLHVEEPSYRGLGLLGKTIFDRLGALAGLLAVSPLLVWVAIAIRGEDGGPVFYRQARIGKGGKEFRMWKFRSMAVDADARLGAVRAGHGDGSAFFKAEDDPRITRIGRMLRATSLDELPQLFNVVSGDMSLVGPRPMVLGEGAEFEGFVERRLLVRPGMTGLWQVSGRSNLSEAERVRLDLVYVENFSMVQDALIIAKTLRAVSARDGAY